jgi:hypothetical protein
MKFEADFERRASWRQQDRKSTSVQIALGRVDGEEKTRFGSIPHGADIAVGYLHDWSVHDIYGYGSHHQPRVESVTEIVIKSEYSATIEYINEIQMVADGAISGTSNAATPWPQQGEHDAALSAIDINRKLHRLNVKARATAMPTKARSKTNTESTTTKWTVSGGVSVSGAGPSGTLGSSYEETEKIENSRSRSTSVPTVTGAHYTRNHSATATKVDKIECGGVSTASRAVQINGHFYTKSFASGGSVSSNGTHGVTNGLRIKVTCTPCEGRTGDPDGEPSESTGNPGQPGGPITPSGESGYGSRQPDPLEPKSRKGTTVTPAQGGASDPGAFWDNPILKGGGCIYIDPEYLPPFVEPIPVQDYVDPDFDLEQFDLGEGRIPLVIPEVGPATDDEQPLVPFGYLKPDAVIEPGAETVVVINPSVNLLTIDGDFRVVDPAGEESDQFQGGATVQFAPGSGFRINGPYEIASLPGMSIRVLESEGVRIHQMVDEAPGASNGDPILHGQVVEDLENPGSVLFSRLSEVELREEEVQSETGLLTKSVRPSGADVEFTFRREHGDVPLVLLSSVDLKNWIEELTYPGEGPEGEDIVVRYPMHAEDGGQVFLKADVLPQLSHGLHLLEQDDLDRIEQRVLSVFPPFPDQQDFALQSVVYPLQDLSSQIQQLRRGLAEEGVEAAEGATEELHLHRLLAERRDLIGILEFVPNE